MSNEHHAIVTQVPSTISYELPTQLPLKISLTLPLTKPSTTLPNNPPSFKAPHSPLQQPIIFVKQTTPYIDGQDTFQTPPPWHGPIVASTSHCVDSLSSHDTDNALPQWHGIFCVTT